MAKVGDLKEWENNPRKITASKERILAKTIQAYGDLSGIIYNKKLDRLVGGHQRRKILENCEIEILERLEKPNEQGTVAVGFAVNGSEKFAYREVFWDEETHEAAAIAANKNAGSWDYGNLTGLLTKLDTGAFDLEMTGHELPEIENIFSGAFGDPSEDDLEEEEEVQSLYTGKIEAPIYEPKGDEPAVEDLFDKGKYNQLVGAISKAKIPEEVKDFLTAAATRHISFDFERVAEYYAHAPKKVQSLMEDSALVIIDFNKAIEHGFVKLTKHIAEINEAEEGLEEDEAY